VPRGVGQRVENHGQRGTSAGANFIGTTTVSRWNSESTARARSVCNDYNAAPTVIGGSRSNSVDATVRGRPSAEEKIIHPTLSDYTVIGGGYSNRLTTPVSTQASVADFKTSSRPTCSIR